jgi:hypothetical protein
MTTTSSDNTAARIAADEASEKIAKTDHLLNVAAIDAAEALRMMLDGDRWKTPQQIREVAEDVLDTYDTAWRAYNDAHAEAQYLHEVWEAAT